MNIATIAALLVFVHCLADYPLQGDFLAKAKNHRVPIPGVPWLTALLSHAAIHAGGVLLVTGSLWFAAAEFIGHSIIDYTKCSGRIGFNADQALHLAMKAGYVIILAFMSQPPFL